MGAASFMQGSGFGATRWSVVVAAGHWRGDSAARRAMSELAGVYWFPLYAYLRRKGLPSGEAEDVVQGFFVHVLEHESLATVDRGKGKFRSFLLAALNNYLANQRDYERAAKRGGGAAKVPIDTSGAEGRYAGEPADDVTPERAYERRWAWDLLDRVMGRLRGDYEAAGKGELFEALKGALTSTAEGPDYESIAGRLKMNKGALQVAAHRLRRRYREMLREEIAQTVASEEMVEEEIGYLLGCL